MKATKFILFFAGLFSLSQMQAQVYGIQVQLKSVTDSLIKGDAIVFSQKTSAILQIQQFSMGKVIVSNLNESEVILKIFTTHYGDTTLKLDLSSTKNSIVLVELTKTAQIDEVTVFAKTPLQEKTNEGFRLNIENTVLANSSNAGELISKLPGISLSGNQLNAFGKGEAFIYLNRRLISFEQFQSIPSSQIKHIEIITNPSARFDAKGRVVINVVLKKNLSDGFEAKLNNNASWGRHFLNTCGLNMNYGKNKISFNSNYALTLGKDWNTNTYSTLFNSPNNIYQTYGYYNENTRSTHVANYRAGVNYNINSETSLSAQYDGLYNLYDLAVQSDVDYYDPAQNKTTINMFNNGSTTNKNNSFNLNFNHNIDTSGSSLFIGGQYNNFETGLYDLISENIKNPNQTTNNTNRINDGYNNIELYTLQTDLSLNLKKQMKFDFGAKYNQVTNSSRIRFLSKLQSEEEYQEKSQYANGFIYTEKVPAAYVMFLGSFKKLDFTVGSRAEYSMVSGYSKKINASIIDTSYFNLFPNASLVYTVNKNWSNSLSYSKRINRPLYQDIDPFVWYIDSLTSIQGNSFLIPELNNSFEYNIAYKDFSLKLSYNTSKNAIRQIVKNGVAGENSVVFTKDNIQNFSQYSVSLDLPFEVKNYNSYTTFACNYNLLKDTRPEFEIQASIPQFYIYTYQQLKFKKLFNIDISGEYYGKYSDGISKRKPYYYLSIGLSRNFMKNKLSCSVLLNDVFKTAYWRGDKKIAHINSFYNQRYNLHYLRLSLAYKFGGLKQLKYKNKSINESEFNRIKI